MKRITTTALVFAGLSLGAPAFLSGQSSTPTSPASQPSTTHPSQDLHKKDMAKDKDKASTYGPGARSSELARLGLESANTAEFRRLSKEALENQTTAKDIIGKDVFGSDGEKLGEISNLVVSGAFDAPRVARAAQHTAEKASTSSLEKSASSALSTESASSSSSSSSANRPSSATTERSTASTTSERNMPRAGDSSSWSSAKAMPASNETRAIISVGGVLGVGENLVSVPMSALRFDEAKEHYTLAVTKAEFSAIAEAKSASSHDDR